MRVCDDMCAWTKRVHVHGILYMYISDRFGFIYIHAYVVDVNAYMFVVYIYVCVCVVYTVRLTKYSYSYPRGWYPKLSKTEICY